MIIVCQFIFFFEKYLSQGDLAFFLYYMDYIWIYNIMEAAI